MRIFVLTFLIACAFYGKAENREIPVTPTQKEDFQDSPYRTPPVIPVVEYDGEVFTVSTPLVVECVPLTICDEDGAVVYSSTDCAASRSHAFTVTALTPGDSYTVEVTIGSVTWTGDFTWESL